MNKELKSVKKVLGTAPMIIYPETNTIELIYGNPLSRTRLTDEGMLLILKAIVNVTTERKFQKWGGKAR